MPLKLGFSKKNRRGLPEPGEAKGDDAGLCPNCVASLKKRTPTCIGWGSINKGDDILSHKTAVPSAQAGLTSLFG
ncbi:hypothetical protein HYN48_07775 [Flavobacterium magnum]|uniref:Uncharacterized protein n=1 Tax=Flavobacterium magnum TaxID=2162713 RepID=A0A2S0RFW4_9FLAO|nr:hypothetical protein HYN48_07775 [Flavobacterium magnum]